MIPAAVAPSTTVPDDDQAPTRYKVGDRLPVVLTLKDLSAILGLSPQRVFQLYEAGEFAFALLDPVVGNKPRFSGLKFQAWMDKESPADVAPLRRTGYLHGRR